MSSKQFRLDSHQKIYHVLQSLDEKFLIENQIYFGGGTLLALQYGEYRWSKDIDLLCSSAEGYKALREKIFEQKHSVLFKTEDNLKFPREIRINRDKITLGVDSKGLIIKFEIVLEGRIELGEPIFTDWTSIPCLSFEDSCTEKLLANSDRWNDKAIESRDLIDLAILRSQNEIPNNSYKRAEKAYSVIPQLKSAIKYFQDNIEYRQKCLKTLQIIDPIKIIDGLDLLATDHGMMTTERESKESTLKNWIETT